VTRRGTTNRNDRGSAQDRRARKLWLLQAFGDGTTAPCAAEVHHKDCPGALTLDTLTVDRIIPGCDRGRYTRDNIRPAWGPCNSVHGSRLRASQPMTNRK